MSKTAAAEPVGELTTEIVTVTPELAGDWLMRNTHNRPLRDQHVQWLARQMEAGEWVLNGESIKFNTSGALIDGQHRLAAVVVSNTPIQTIVVHHAPADAFETIDSGKRRNAADALALLGETSAHTLAACLQLLFRYERREMTGLHVRPSTQTIIQFLEAHPDMREAVRVGFRAQAKVRGATSTVLAVAWYLFAQLDRESASEFMDRLATGANLTTSDPIYRLRERFLANADAKLRMQQPELLALTIKAWNYWRVGRETQQLSWRFRGGEAFPEPQ